MHMHTQGLCTCTCTHKGFAHTEGFACARVHTHTYTLVLLRAVRSSFGIRGPAGGLWAAGALRKLTAEGQRGRVLSDWAWGQFLSGCHILRNMFLILVCVFGVG